MLFEDQLILAIVVFGSLWRSTLGGGEQVFCHSLLPYCSVGDDVLRGPLLERADLGALFVG